MTRVAYLGPEATFSHVAAKALIADLESAELVPFATVTLAVDALRAGDVARAVVPLENSVEGAVPATLDELANGEPLVITAETYLRVEFDLLVRPGFSPSDIVTIATHPHAEAQVRRYLLDHFPNSRTSMVGSTAGGARAVRDGEFDAAVSPPAAGEHYGLDVAAHDIADNVAAVTRFVLLSSPLPPVPRTGNDRTSLVLYMRENHPGALLEILTEFGTRGIDLTRIESRPTKEQLGSYCFSVDCEGHIDDARVGDAVAALHRICREVRYLGSYVRRDGRQTPVHEARTDDAFADAAAWLEAVRTRGTAL